MDASQNIEGPALLQLHRWDHSQVQLDLSEYPEAFISPTRELLVLLSYHCEALLLPLVRGNAFRINDDTDRSENQQIPLGSSASSKSVPSTLKSVYHGSSNVDSLQPNTSLTVDSLQQFLPDVNSLAWGVCEDGYNQQKESPFRELLFVCGNRGVTVHAFGHFDGSDTAHESECGEWMEWRPSTAPLPHAVTRLGDNNWSGEIGSQMVSDSKKWMRSFFTRAETKESDGIIRTWFPANSVFPHSTRIVSFSLFDDASSIFYLLSDENTERGRAILEPIVAEIDHKSGASIDKSISSKCSKVFSSYSNNFVGFVFDLFDSALESSVDATVNSLGKMVRVVKLDSFGIQWLCSVRLQQTTMNAAATWTDFQFTNGLLVCLNTSGLISFHEVMTGELVVCLEVTKIYGCKGQLKAHRQEEMLVDGNLIQGVHSTKNELGGSQLTPQNGDTAHIRKSCRLIVVPNTALLAVVDEYGSVYVICGSDHVPKEHFSYEELLLQYKRIGALAPWDVGYSDISEQKVSATSLGLDDAGRVELQTVRKWSLQGMVNENDLHLSGFSDSFQKHVKDIDQFGCPKIARNVFLPVMKASKDDTICFSSIGVTRLMPRDNKEGRRIFHIVHTNLLIEPTFCNDRCLNSTNDMYDFHLQVEITGGKAISCIFQGCLYLVTRDGLSVVLPRISISTDLRSVDAIGCQASSVSQTTAHPSGIIFEAEKHREVWSNWKVEILDRFLSYEAPDEADLLTLENGWGIKLSRLRRLQLALDYLKFDEMEQSIAMLTRVNMAEEGVLRLIFAAVYMMFHRIGKENEVSAASRILSLAAHVATKLIREYAMREHNRNEEPVQGQTGMKILLLPMLPHEVKLETCRIEEMAQLLEIIRNLQRRLSTKYRRTGQVSEGKEPNSAEKNLLLEESQVLAVTSEETLIEEHNQKELALLPMELGYEEHALVPAESSGLGEKFYSEMKDKVSFLQQEIPRKKDVQVQNPKEMIARWEIDNLELKDVVKDALFSGRLPLAVLQLHLYRLKDLAKDKEPNDTFNEVRDVGRAIAYDLFLKGEIGLAVTTLQKLGEDIEGNLKQLFFGTLSRPLRNQMAEVMAKYGYIGANELAILERISLIERIYPSCSFWRSYEHCKEKAMRESMNLLVPSAICLLHQYSFGNFVINCGEVDGVVLGPWANLDSSFSSSDLVKGGDEGGSYAGYWAAAAVWSSGWERKTIDRILLDQSSFMGADLLWESQLDYHMCHNDWEEVYKLADIIPSFLLSSGSLQVSLDGMQSTSFVGSSVEFPDYDGYAVSSKELDTMCFDVPQIKILQSAAHFLCSTWLRKLMEKELAKRFIFLKEYYQEIAEIVSLLAQSGFIAGEAEVSSQDASLYSVYVPDFVGTSESPDRDTKLAFHRLLIHYCIEYNLPYLLDLYLDHHKLALSDDSLKLFLDAAGDCQWAKWLLFSRAKGQEYEASFYNARAIAFSRSRAGSGLASPGTDEIIHTVDDIAEGGWLMAALATLMFAPFPIQNCLSHGSVNRRISSSAQCTFENLRPVLQQFPTLWRMLLGVSLGQDTTFNFRGSKVSNALGTSALSMYLNWRENIFVSSGHDSSLVQLLPFWFPKSVRKLIRLFVQGPLGWQTMTDIPADGAYMAGDIYLFGNEDEYSEISPLAWEAALQKQIEQELCASSVKEARYGLEHHLHRGRALAAFKQFLEFRIEKLKSDHPRNGQHETNAVREQADAQSDVQALLADIKLDEEQLLASVIPLAIANHQNLVVVTSCAFLLELCGLSASMLRVDIAALRRISDFYKDNENIRQNKQLSPKLASVYDSSEECGVADSLARALADNYLLQDSRITKQETSVPPARVLAIVLQHLEKASLPVTSDAHTCGSWLSSGSGDGSELRSRQKASSQHWSLVTAFCQMHQIPLSTKYLAWLARDNDWVGFLSEAQIGGYALETVTQVAVKEFSDPRLKTHILTVLRGMRLRSKVSLPSSSEGPENTRLSVQNFYAPVELFGVLADCEKQKQPGNSLLVKAKQLSWSILAIIASCFPDVSPFACLTVWLEITDARDASLANANEVASQIANRTAAAVEATNSLPTSDGMIAHHYNRKNPKRRRLMDPMPADLSASPVFDPESSCVRAHDAEHDTESRDCARPIEWWASLPNLVAMLCEQQQFLPLLRAFEMFLPSCSLLPFIRALQAFSQMRLSEASAHLGSFSVRIKEEHNLLPSISEKGLVDASWVASTATKAADAMLSSCPSPYEKRSLLQLLAATDFGDVGSTATYYRQQYWKINLAEPALRNDDLDLGDDILDDAALLTALETNGHWEQARNWSKQLEAMGGSWKSVVHHVTETQAENMVAEWKEFLWDVPEERVALWGHCQTLFIRYSFPALQAGLFFLKHAEAVEKDIPPRELHELLLLSMQWLCGMITQSNPVYPLHLLREIETRVWLLAVESEAEMTSETDFSFRSSINDRITGNDSNIIDKTANIVSKMDNHINAMKSRTSEKADLKDSNLLKISPIWDASIVPTAGSTKSKRRARAYGSTRRSVMDATDKSTNIEDSSSPPSNFGSELQDESANIETTFSRWEDTIGPGELERAVLSLLDFGQIAAAKQLQHKLSPGNVPPEFIIVDAAIKLAELSTPVQEIPSSSLEEDLRSVIQSYNIPIADCLVDPEQVLENLSAILTEGSGRGLCKKIIAIVKAANVMGISFSEAFHKQPAELLQLLSLKAQDSFEEAKLLLQTHSLPAKSIAKILAESFLKGLLAAHRGGYIDSQKEEGPAPLLWRFSDFLKWAELCPSVPEVGHALMRLVITGQEIPHECEVELLILSHHFYKSSACLDGVDVLVALAATRVEAYVAEGDFSCMARLITGVGNFHALNFILGILIENGQLDLLLHKYSTATDGNTNAAEAVRGFRMAVLTSLKHFSPNDLDAFAMVYNHFDMKHETASLLESRAEQASRQWFQRYYKYQNEDLLESMRFYIEAAEVHSSIDAGNKTRASCARASLVSLQIRMPDIKWLNLSETNARRALVEQSQFQEALIVAEAYDLNQPGEWALVLWNQMLKPELIEAFVAEFVAVLPLQPSMLLELARFYRAEVAARGDQSQFSVWVSGGGLPAEWAKYLGRSFRCLLKRTRDLRLRSQLASVATGFVDVINSCNKVLDKVPENAGPLVLRKGHGGAYLPLM